MHCLPALSNSIPISMVAVSKAKAVLDCREREAVLSCHPNYDACLHSVHHPKDGPNYLPMGAMLTE